MNKPKQFNPRELFFTPAESSAVSVEYLEWVRNAPGLRWGVPSIDKTIIPMRPGDRVGIIGRPGHGKSTTLAYLAKHTALNIPPEQLGKKCVVYVTLEQSIEEVEMCFQANHQHGVTDWVTGKTPLEFAKKRALQRVNLPIWTIGRSLLRRRRVPHLTCEIIYQAIDCMADEFGVEPVLVVVDYIQILPVERARSKQEQVETAMEDSKELLQNTGCPGVFGVQASREVEKRDDQVPTMADCQHSSSLEQGFDKLFGAWRPWLSLTHRERRSSEGGDYKVIKFEGVEYEVTPRLYVLRNIKQRFAPSGWSYLIDFDPEFIRLSDLELEQESQGVERPVDLV